MPAMQDVKDAIGEDDGTDKLRQPRRQLRGARDDFGLAAGQSVYSNSRTTLCTPLTWRAASVARSACSWLTRPMRWTTESSVTTLIWVALRFSVSSILALTCPVIQESCTRLA